MRVRHSEVVVWENDPATWVVSKLSTSFFPPWTYDGILRHGIHRFHRTKDSANARRHIQSLFARSNLRNVGRTDDVYDRFGSHVVWHNGNAVITCDSRARIELPVGQWIFCGEVGRVDISPSGYRAVLLGTFPQDWSDQLRMPLIHKAIALRYKRPVGQVSIAVQELDGSGLSSVTFPGADIVAAESRFSALAGRMAALLARAGSGRGAQAPPTGP